MNVNILFDDEQEVTIENYLKLKGVEDVARFIAPDKTCMEDCGDFDNMEEGFNLLKEYL